MIIGFLGLPGRGKSLSMLRYGFELANSIEPDLLVFNFSINVNQLIKYAYKQRLWWILRMAQRRDLIVRDVAGNLGGFMDIPNAWYFMDEMGIYAKSSRLGSSDAYNQREDFLDGIKVHRHSGKNLCYTAQNWKQLHTGLKVITERVVHCEGIVSWSTLNSKMKFPILRTLSEIELEAERYERWLQVCRGKMNLFTFLKTRALATRITNRLLNDTDRMIFKIYNSFDKSFQRELQEGPKLIGMSQVSNKVRFVSEPHILFNDVPISSAMEANRIFKKYTPTSFVVPEEEVK